jgi:multiple sugar transport system substrate-binding protein
MLALLLVSAFVAAGCGGSADAHSGVPVLHFTASRDSTGFLDYEIKACNAQAKGKYTLEPVLMPPTVDGMREQMIRRLAAKDPSLDIYNIDVVWTAEFSSAGWLYDLTDRMEPHANEFVPASLQTVKYKGKYWARPVGTSVAVLYYRTDLVKKPPATWEELVSTAKAVQKTHPGMAGFLFQGNQYEGLTVDSLEFVHAAGGSILGPDEAGDKVTIADDDKALEAFKFMRSLFTDGVTPKTVGTFQEEESRLLFQSGKAVYLRNWTYVDPLARKPGSAVRGKFGVAPLPRFEGKKPGGIIGGGNLAISRFTKHPDLAWDAVSCMSSAEMVKKKLLMNGELPPIDAVYSDPEVKAKVPFITAARKGLDAATSRPVTPYYNDVTVPIAKNTHEVLTGSISPEEAVKRIKHAVSLGVKGEGEV